MKSKMVDTKLKSRAGTIKLLSAAILLGCFPTVFVGVPAANSTAPSVSVNGPYPQYIDLSHLLHNGTLHWPSNQGFSHFPKEIIQDLQNGVNQFLFTDSISTATHTGTHLDAPRHFNQTAWTVDMIPLDRLIDVPLFIFNVSEKVAKDRSYSITKDDVRNALPNSLVLVYTGISQDYDKGAVNYFGTATTNMSAMKLPGFSPEASTFLAKEVKVYGVGLDSASVDSSTRHLSSATGDLIAHRIFGENNVYMIENVHKNLELLFQYPKDKSLAASINPLPIVGGSGTPIRLVARVGSPREVPRSGSLSLSVSFYSTAALVITSLLAFTCL